MAVVGSVNASASISAFATSIGPMSNLLISFFKNRPSACRSGSPDPTYSLRRYLHIEAVFVFVPRADHLSAASMGRPNRIALVLCKGGPMPNLIYRVVSACGALGYGYPRESLQAALRGRVDAIVCDGGSIDAGPYYLGTGRDYFERDAVKADYRPMAEAGKEIGCPVIVGSSGMAGGDRNLDRMVEIAKEVFDELGIHGAKVAVIRAQLESEIVVREYRNGTLRPTGAGPELGEDALRESMIVGQMGIHPLITALEGDAQFIFAGRACDSALFAADMIRRGIDAGLAYHAGHILESGALACDPGSPSDCLIAEIYDDGTAIFSAANPGRRCTAHSLAAHSLYQQSHPQLLHFPEGVLATEHTQFFSHDSRSAGIRNSRFIRASEARPWSVKLEGSRRLGTRKVSLIYIDPIDLPKIPPEILVYGRNGVQATPVGPSQRELGIIVETTAGTAEKAIRLARLLAHHLAHCGFPGRKATAGNIAYPLSPEFIGFRREDGSFGALVAGGTRDPAFIENYAKIKSAVIKSISAEAGNAMVDGDFTITEADDSNPAILLRTVDRDLALLSDRHKRAIDDIVQVAKPKTTSRLDLNAPDAYAWSLYHLLQNGEVIRNEMFPIAYYEADGAHWIGRGGGRARYFDVGESGYRGDLDERTLSLIAEHPPCGEPIGSHRLRDMAAIIRSKDAGVNRITFDIFFASGENYEAALYSNAFSKDNAAKILKISPRHVIGTFFIDACNAIKISIDRPNISASSDERDVFGAQQQAALECMHVPIYAAALTQASSF
jgi:Domain of unknown function (DUF4387)/Acyclic terpene utilisation family protein AtuA